MKLDRIHDEKRCTTQLVLEVPAGNARDPRFGMLMLPGKYAQVITNPVVAGFFKMSDDPLPFLMARADGCVEALKEGAFRLVYSFFRMPAGGIFGAFLEFDSPALAKASPTGFPILEMTYGLDMEETRTLIRDGATRQPAHIVFTAGSGRGTYTSFDPVTGEMSDESSMPECEFDRVFELPSGFTAAFSKEFDGLLAYHRSLRSPDFQRSMEQMCEMFPVSESPILQEVKAHAGAKRASPATPSGGNVVPQTVAGKSPEVTGQLNQASPGKSGGGVIRSFLGMFFSGLRK